MIVKIQMSLTGPSQVLIYNQDRSLFEITAPWKDLIELVGTELKIYCRAELDKDGLLHIGKRVEEQEW